MSDSEYRYLLERGVWLNGVGTVLFVMLNPSTATATRDDPTVRRCVGFAQSWGFARLTVGNLYGLRATDPDELFGHSDPVGPGNDEQLARMARDATEMIVAWGASRHPLPDRAGQVLDLLERFGGAVRCLGQTKELHPRHPLYLPRTAKRVPFRRLAVSMRGG